MPRGCGTVFNGQWPCPAACPRPLCTHSRAHPPTSCPLTQPPTRPRTGTVLVADTNNSLIRRFEPSTGRLSTLALVGVPGPRVSPDAAVAARSLGACPGGPGLDDLGKMEACCCFFAVRGNACTSDWPHQLPHLPFHHHLHPTQSPPTPHHPSHPTPPLLLSLSAADSGLPDGATLVRFPSPFTSDQAELRLKIQLPPGYHLTKGANSGFQAAVVGGEAAAAAVEVSPARGALQEGGGGAVSATLAVRRRPGGALAPGAVLRVLSKVYFCQQDDACLFEEVVFEVPLAERAQQQPGFKEEHQLLEMSHSVSASAPQVTLPGL